MFRLPSATANIIGLDARRQVDPDRDCFAELESYWTALAAGRIMPLRDEVDPRGLVGSLDRIFLIERIAPGVARFRLAGQHLNGLMDMDLRGMPLSAMFTPAGRVGLSETLHAVFDEPARVELTLDGPRKGMRGRMAARLMMLPLRDREGQVSRAIGCLVAGGATAKAPQRFDIISEDRRTLVGFGDLETLPAAQCDPFDAVDHIRGNLQRRQDVRQSLRVISND